jgi:organic hydroperoxide reductase OsmC/OhrA
MVPFPHRYSVSAEGVLDGDVTLRAAQMPVLVTASPAEFGGPGDRWSPETLLVGSVADCFILTFRAIARASSLPWTSLACDVDGTLDRVERVTQFTGFDIRARLVVPEGTDKARATRLLQKAEETCLVTNSLKATCRFQAQVEAESGAVVEAVV